VSRRTIRHLAVPKPDQPDGNGTAIGPNHPNRVVPGSSERSSSTRDVRGPRVAVLRKERGEREVLDGRE